jgi:hypothetical protein
MNHYGYDNDRFYIEWKSCNYIPSSIRDAWEYRARELHSQYKDKIIIGMSSGLDCQAVLYSFLVQNIPVKTAFFYMKGYNDFEYENLKILEKKFHFKINFLIEIDPNEVREEVIAEAELNNNPQRDPYLKKRFIKRLPNDHAFVYGNNGPNLFVQNDTWVTVDCPGDFGVLLASKFNTNERTGPIVIWEYSSEIAYAVLKDEYVKSLLTSFSYYRELDKDQGINKIPFYGYWDVYVKPFVYAKHWKDDLIYFPKYMGVEKIDYIMESPLFDYSTQLVVMKYNDLINLFESKTQTKKRYYGKDY